VFNLFGKKKGTIDSITLPDFGWEQVKSDANVKQWINPESTMALSTNFFAVVPDIPTMSDIHALRAFYRTQLSKNNGGLIQVDFITLKGYKAIKTVFKFQQEAQAITYLVSLTIPFSHCSYVLKIQAAEREVTGIREAVVANRMLKKGTISVGEGGYENWSTDPYDTNLTGGFLMNCSEEPAYDIEFPQHPLSQARNTIAIIEEQLEFGSDLQKLKGFRQ